MEWKFSDFGYDKYLACFHGKLGVKKIDQLPTSRWRRQQKHNNDNKIQTKTWDVYTT